MYDLWAQNHLQDAYLFQGKVYANFSKEAGTEEYILRIGSTEIPFRDTLPGAFDPHEFGQDLPLDVSNAPEAMLTEPAEPTPGAFYNSWVNELSEWMLAGAQTIQIQVVRRGHPLKLVVLDGVKIGEQKREMDFRAELAVHRANAELLVRIEDIFSGEISSETIPFRADCPGGKLEQDYQQVRVRLPHGPKGLRLFMTVMYNSYQGREDDYEPFLFIAKPRLTPRQQVSPLVSPVHLVERPRPGSGRWAEAPLPRLMGAGERLQIVHRSDAIDIHVGDKTKIDLIEYHGHTIVVSSTGPNEAILCIDGETIRKVLIGGNTAIRLPSEYLNGHQRHVCLKDRSGSQILWEAPLVVPNILTPPEIIQRESCAPFPATLFPQTARRYAALKAHIENLADPSGYKQLSRALAVLEGGYENVRLERLDFPVVENPDVSIVIPAHNRVHVTYFALCSLLLAYNRASFEVIVVDDASTDETAELERIVSGITVIHNETAQRFVRACNAGAETARGEFIVLLNNDVEASAYWLDELIAAFGRFPNVGLAGSKLLYPDGSLQDAGGIVWGTGNPWNYGNRQNPDDPRYSYARQADYLSGAAMMVPSDLWRELGGLSGYLEPMYFEDTDFAFKVRDAGRTTWFVPSSVVYHYEGMTSGTDTSSGFKRFQEINRPKFKRRWAAAYAGHGPEGVNPDLEKDRGIMGRVLFVDYTTPRPDRDAGSYAAIQEIRLVQSLGYKVTFLPMNLAHFGSYTDELQKMGVEVIYAPFYLSPAEYLEQHAARFDAFYLTRYYVAKDVLPMIRQRVPAARVLFNNADLHFLREIRAAKAANSAPLMAQARHTRDQELDVIGQVDVVLSYNEVEHSVIQAYTEGGTQVVKCPWVVETVDAAAPLSGRRGMSFLGSYRHHPNAEGITWFVREVMPAIAARTGGVPLWIYGSGMTEEIRALKSELVFPEGFVADTAAAMDPHRIFIAPLLSGAGIKGKVLGAMARGIPCILTPTAAEGIGLRHKHDCFIAETPEEWAAAVQALNQDDALWQRISDTALAYMRDAYSFDLGRRRMRAAFEAVDMFQSLD